MGAVDLVVQVESPPSVASGLQRVGRAGHQVGEVSRGVLLPKHRGDLVQTAVAVERMRAGAIESLRVPAQPARRARPAGRGRRSPSTTWDVDELFDAGAPGRAVRLAAAVSAYDATLDLLAGRYPSRRVRRAAAAARLGPGRRHAHRPAGRAAARGDQRRHDPRPRAVRRLPRRREGRRRVGELDEEMVYESRVGDVFTLGATCWRIEDITHDRVLVSPAPGQPGRLPFWKGDALGRPAELGARDRRVHPRARRRCRATRRVSALPRGRARRVGRRQPGRLPRRAARGHRHAARRPHDRGRAVPRRARRLAAGRPLAVRRAGARAVGAGDRRRGCASATASTPRRCPPTTASCCGSRRPTRTRRAPS